MSLDAIAGELYGLVPADFITARDARAAEARRSGDRELANALKKLRRPSTGAWLANILVRERHEQVSDLVAVGAALRDAQARLANDDLRRLSKERRRVVATLADEAFALARDRGQAVSSATARELETTLEAAALDADAASELEAGRLTVALHYAGLGWSGSAEPSPTTTEDKPSRPAPPARSPATARADAEKVGSESRLAAGAALRAAEAAAEAGRQLEERQRQVEEARLERDQRRRQRADLEDRLGEARDAEQQAERGLDDAEKELAGAQRQARAANDKLR
jgi:hypothetical protein